MLFNEEQEVPETLRTGESLRFSATPFLKEKSTLKTRQECFDVAICGKGRGLDVATTEIRFPLLPMGRHDSCVLFKGSYPQEIVLVVIGAELKRIRSLQNKYHIKQCPLTKNAQKPLFHINLPLAGAET